MFASVVAGVRVVGASDDTVPVLAARGPLAAGERVEDVDLVSVQLRFASKVDADRYLPGDTVLGEGAVLLRPVGAGELIPRTAVSVGDDGALAELPLAVDAGRVPAGVRPGSTVDVWVAAAKDSGAAAPAERLLAEAPVLSTSRGAAAGPGGLRQVVVGVPSADEPELASVVSRLGEESLLIVRRPG